jgi:CRISPR-associated protein Cas1
VAADSGYLTLDAIRWAKAAGVALIVVDSDAELVLAPAGGSADARVVRVQAAPPTELAAEAARQLLRPKVTGQALIASDILKDHAGADTLSSLAEAMDQATSVDECRQLEASAAACYFAAWADHAATTMHFIAKDARRVPAHWATFDGRRSLLTGGVSPRKAERPTNALLNLAYYFGVIEARQAAVAVGLHPGLGIVHADQPGKDALAFDLVEPIRPAVERLVLELLAGRMFTKADFVERSDGSVRIGHRLVQELAGTMPAWAREVAPHAERLAHLLGRAVTGKWTLRTPLTKSKGRQAAAAVKARKVSAKTASAHSVGPRARARRQDPDQAVLGLFGCVECGCPVSSGRHVRCDGCIAADPRQTADRRARRGAAISGRKRKQTEWEAAHPGQVYDPDYFVRDILPGLRSVTLAEIMRVTGLSKGFCSRVRAGQFTPHISHWAALADLVGVAHP